MRLPKRPRDLNAQGRIARELWEKTRSTRSAGTGEERTVAMATAPDTTMAAETPTGPGPGSDAAARLEHPEASHQ
jgi:hypothetical protein